MYHYSSGHCIGNASVLVYPPMQTKRPVVSVSAKSRVSKLFLRNNRVKAPSARSEDRARSFLLTETLLVITS
jgi:hypothetical protein